LPTVPIQEIELYEDGRAIRSGYPIASSPQREIALTADEQRAFAALQTVWCQQLPTFRTLIVGEPFYDLGIRCGGWPSTEVKQTRVPLEALPPIFDQLIKRLPPVATSTP
jgi:hypothetical protein